MAAHCNGLPELAAGMKALPDTALSFSHTQSLWRFLSNDRVTPSHLGGPLLSAAREGVASCCQDFALVMHDWSRLNYHRHRSKPDRRRMTHDTDVGYELQSSLVVGDVHGEPLSPVAQNLVTNQQVLSSWSSELVLPPHLIQPRSALSGGEAQGEASSFHLDELSERMNWLASRDLGKPLIHLVDREGESVAHLRRWTAEGNHWLVRAKAGSRVRSGEQDMRLEAVAAQLTYQAVREIDYQGQPCRQWVAQAQVVLARPARPKGRSADGKRQAHQPGEPISVRLVVSRIENQAGEALAIWYLLAHLPEAADGKPIAAETVALWYYYRWRIESFFKLLKQAGQQLEHWEQESGSALFKRLLIASQACVLTWRLMQAQGHWAKKAQQFLVRLSGRQTKRSKPITAPAVLAGLHMLFSILEVLSHYFVEYLQEVAHFAFPQKYKKRRKDV